MPVKVLSAEKAMKMPKELPDTALLVKLLPLEPKRIPFLKLLTTTFCMVAPVAEDEMLTPEPVLVLVPVMV